MPIIGAQWFLTGTGVCAGNHLHTGAFIRSRADPELDHPDIQFHFLPRNRLLNYRFWQVLKTFAVKWCPWLRSKLIESQVIDHGRKPPDREAYQVHVGTLRAKSVGFLKVKSPNPREHPIIDPKYFTDPTDLPDLVAAVKLTREIFSQKAFDEFRGPEVIPGAHVKTDKGICHI